MSAGHSACPGLQRWPVVQRRDDQFFTSCLSCVFDQRFNKSWGSDLWGTGALWTWIYYNELWELIQITRRGIMEDTPWRRVTQVLKKMFSSEKKTKGFLKPLVGTLWVTILTQYSTSWFLQLANHSESLTLLWFQPIQECQDWYTSMELEWLRSWLPQKR